MRVVETSELAEPIWLATAMMILINVYGVTLAISSIFRGIRQRAVLTLNGGLFLMAALVSSRFVDSNSIFVQLDLALFLLGVLAFLGVFTLEVNLWLLKIKCAKVSEKEALCGE